MNVILMIIVAILHGEGMNSSIALVLVPSFSSTLHINHSNESSALLLVALQYFLTISTHAGLVSAHVSRETYLSANMEWY